MAYNETVNIDINASTSDAEQSVSRLENNIKTLDGAINLVGGSIEVLAGSLALSGAVTEEQAEKFQTAAVGAIALADGSKRVLEGYKILATETKVFTGLQRVLNAVMKANPIGLIVTAVAALTAAYVIFRKSQQANQEVIQTTNEKLEEQLKLLKESSRVYLNAEEQLKVLEAGAKARNRTIEEEIAAEKERIDLAQKSIDEDLKRARSATKINQDEVDAILLRREEANKYYNQIVAAEELYTKKQKEEGDKQTKEYERRKAERDKEIQELFDFYSKMLRMAAKVRKDAYNEFQKDLSKSTDETFEQTQKSMEDRMKLTAKMYQENSQQAQKSTVEIASANLFAYSELAEVAVGDSIDAFGQLFKALGEVTGEGNEEAFEKGKKYKIAEVVTSAIQASFQAFGAAQQFGPILGPILGAAQVAAIAAASSRAVQDIKSSEFGGSATTPGLAVSSTPNLSTGLSSQIGGIPQIPGFGTSGVQTLNAVVLSGDVTSAQAQDTAIRNRRRFGG